MRSSRKSSSDCIDSMIEREDGGNDRVREPKEHHDGGEPIIMVGTTIKDCTAACTTDVLDAETTHDE